MHTRTQEASLEIEITDQMMAAGVEALRTVIGNSEESRSVLIERDPEAVRLVYLRMRALEAGAPLAAS